MIKKMYSSQNLAQRMRLLMDDIAKILNAASELKEIKNSGELTNARVNLEVEIERKRAEWLILQPLVDDYIRQLEIEMQPASNHPDNVVEELRQREIRDYLRTLDPVDVEEKYVSAAQVGDELFLSAIEQSPIPFKFATGGLGDNILTTRCEQANPGKASRLADLKLGKANVLSALRSSQSGFPVI